MAAAHSGTLHAMNGGYGIYSYKNNSFYQKRSIFSVRELIHEAVSKELDANILSLSDVFRFADMGCCVGPNTLVAIQSILEAVENKLLQQESFNLRSPEYQVFLNDVALNDFNTLFTSLPPNRQSYAAGIPGSFHGRLFLKASLHIVHSSFSIQWLSQVPKEVMDRRSPAWNNGRIHYSNAEDGTVVKAYGDQFAKDKDCFLSCRAQEVVSGGLVMLLFPHVQMEALILKFLPI